MFQESLTNCNSSVENTSDCFGAAGLGSKLVEGSGRDPEHSCFVKVNIRLKSQTITKHGGFPHLCETLSPDRSPKLAQQSFAVEARESPTTLFFWAFRRRSLALHCNNRPGIIHK